MQPYLFPYMGYYQLVHAVDTFVFFDDVNFIMKGWINRNQILRQDQAHKFVLPLEKASQNRLINEIPIADLVNWKKDFLRTIEFNYRKAPYFSHCYALLDEILSKKYAAISELAANSIKTVAGALQLPTTFLTSGSLNYKIADGQKGQQKVLAICKLLGAQTYVNPMNGIGLYDRNHFSAENIQLYFIKMGEVTYEQWDVEGFVPNLSIIDVLMFNSIEDTRRLMQQYSFV